MRQVSRISRRMMASKSSLRRRGQLAPDALPFASVAIGRTSRWMMMVAAFAMHAWVCPLGRSTIRRGLNFPRASPTYRSLPIIDDYLQRWFSVARSKLSGSEGRSPQGSSALRHFVGPKLPIIDFLPPCSTSAPSISSGRTREV